MAKRGSRRAGQRSSQSRAKPPTVCSVEVHAVADDGRGIARLDGKVAFVTGALPGERVAARVADERRRFVEMDTVTVERASTERVEPRCPHYGACGGCTLQHWRHDAQVAHKESVVRRQLGLADGDPRWQPPLTASGWGYRRRARLAVGRDRGGLVVGFRRGHSHRPVDISVCPVLHPDLERLLPALHEVLGSPCAGRLPREVELAMYDEADCPRAVTRWDFGGPVPAALKQVIAQWAAGHGVDAWLVADETPLSLVARGDYRVQLDDCGLSMGVRPGDFSQVNIDLNRALIARVVEWLDPGPDDNVADLFCGVGNFSLPLARRAAQVTGAEQSAAMVERLHTNAAAIGLDNVEALCADLATGLSGLSGKQFDAVLLDPPRRGAQAVAAELGRLGAHRVAYVSCDPATLGRDAALITAQGYVVKAACMADMFAQTAHTEALVLFER